MNSVFVPMIDVIPPSQFGSARVEHFDVSEDASMMTALRPGEYVPPGRYARLYVGGTMFMSDTPMERNTNYSVVRNAHGDVLIAGLGIGLILVPILKKADVRHVTVIEKSADVVALVAPQFACDRLTVICADIYEWRPAKGTKFNTVYFDIWSGQSTDDLEDMTRLHRTFRPFFVSKGDDPVRWMDSWRRDILRSDKRREKREEWRWR